MRIAQITNTIIGEGLYTGEPCLLVRFTGCNLHCKWCDTPEARRGGLEVPFGKIMERGISNSHKWILLTGGEPLMQKNLSKLIQQWTKAGKKVLIETNGTFPIEKLVIDGVLFSIDVKTPSSGEKNKFLMRNLNFLKQGDAIKFVIADADDFKWSQAFIKSLKTSASIFFQPVWKRLSPKKLAQLIIESGLPVRLGLQVHKMIKIA